MKKWIRILIIPLALACTNKNKKIRKLQLKNDSLITLNLQKDKELNDYVSSLNQIQENLQLIKETEKLVTINAKGDIEKKDDIKDKIKSDVQLIYQLICKVIRKLSPT